MMLVTFAASSLFSYSEYYSKKNRKDDDSADIRIKGNDLLIKTIMNLIGLPKNIPISDCSFDDYENGTLYATAFIRSYFAAKTIQKAWRKYKQIKIKYTQTQIVQTNQFNDNYKIKYALLKYWIDYCDENWNEELENIIINEHQTLPSFWNNILDFVISSYHFIDPDRKHYHNPDATELTYMALELIRANIDSSVIVQPSCMAYFVKNHNLLPFHIISRAVAAIYKYDFIDDNTYKNTFFGICGIPQDTKIKNRIYEMCDEEELMPYGLSLMRSYFSPSKRSALLLILEALAALSLPRFTIFVA